MHSRYIQCYYYKELRLCWVVRYVMYVHLRNLFLLKYEHTILNFKGISYFKYHFWVDKAFCEKLKYFLALLDAKQTQQKMRMESRLKPKKLYFILHAHSQNGSPYTSRNIRNVLGYAFIIEFRAKLTICFGYEMFYNCCVLHRFAIFLTNIKYS